MSSNAARELVLSRPTVWSGMDAYLLTDDLARALNLPQPAGLLVQRVAGDSPASEAGLRAGGVQATIAGAPLLVGGDIILAVADVPVAADDTSLDRIRATLDRARPGESVGLTVLRDGHVVGITARVRAP